MGVGFGNKLNNKLYWKRKSGGVRSRCLLEQLSWIPGEKWTEAVSSSQEKPLPALSTRRKPEPPSLLEKLLRAEIRTAKAPSHDLVIFTSITPGSKLPATCSNSIWD